VDWSRFRQRMLRYWVYFRRGHSMYLVFLMSFANFVVIQYRLLLQYVEPLKLLFSNLTAFAVAFFAVYVPLAVVIGWLDFRRGAAPTEAAITGEVNPWVRDLLYAVYSIAEGRGEEARAALEKWVSKR